MNRFRNSICALLALSMAACSGSKKETVATGDVELWLTTGDRTHLFEKVAGPLFADIEFKGPVIEVDTSVTYQTMDGFGYSLTGGSAYHINQKLDSATRSKLLHELFSTEGNSIGISYLRISIGASDLDDHVFSYNDLPKGQVDLKLEKFTLDEDRKNLIPVLKQILAIDPSIKIMGSPWSPPAWMKTNNSPKGGYLKPEYYSVYAAYLARYIQEMAKEGITIDAITLQNEPENPKNNPSLLMTAEQQAEFIRDHAGPLFRQQGIAARIVLFDHNCDHPEYPITVLNDPEARQYVDGSAFHLYLGEIEALTKVHDAHPDKNLYFTEQWTSPQGTFDGDLRWHVRNLVAGAPRNWSRVVLEWNLAADADFQPHTDQGGCTECLGALTIQDLSVTRNVAYYIIAHASKFVRPGSVRVQSNIVDDLYNVAYLTPSGKRVLVVVNDSDEEKRFAIAYKGKKAETILPAASVGTYVW
ncbi:MAG: glucosylceramidase [Cyclobacteriaceae bacterium]|nr:glucosylceramidase [Cyclobacteriaceae bacterium]